MEDRHKEDRELEQKRLRQRRGGPGPGGPGGPGVGMPVEKAKNFKGTLSRLAGYLRPHGLLLIFVFIITILSTVLSSYAPKVLAQIVDILEYGLKNPDAGIDFSAITRICVFIGFIYVVSAAFTLIQQFSMIRISQSLVFDMRSQIDEKLARLPLKYFDTHSRGDILSRVANDVENISMTIQMSLSQMISAVVTVVSVLFFMLITSALMTGIALLTVALCFVFTLFIARFARKHFTEQWASTGRLNGQIEEMYTGHNIVKVFNRQYQAVESFKEENEILAASSNKAQFISGLIMPATGFINNLNYVIICLVGGMRVISGGMSLGDVTAIVSYSKQLMQPINMLSQVFSNIQSTIASAERVFEMLDAGEETPDKENPPAMENPRVIRFEDVSFSYSSDKKLIEHLNLEVRPGDMVAIVGPTGAGKTTLVNLLMRFYEVDSGRITIDGVDIREFSREELRGKIGMVLQDTWLFGGTIQDNIAYGYNAKNGEASKEQISQAAKMAYVDHFVKTLSEGYDTVINDDANNISQGQKQLMTIARAFLSDPSILILDEATSSVDTRTEVLIQKAMHKLMQNRTSFVIAHRLSTIRDADTIIVMNEGSIIEQGNHEQLLAAKGFYYDLYNSQFTSGVEEDIA